jgi:hypothetical protein
MKYYEFFDGYLGGQRQIIVSGSLGPAFGFVFQDHAFEQGFDYLLLFGREL